MRTQLETKSEVTGFTKAMHEWLSGEVTGHLGTYMYTDDKDDHRWKDGHSASSYYLSRDDKATFDLAVHNLGIEAKCFLDLGPGGEASVRAKSIPIMKAINASEYYPVDLSLALADEALKTVNRDINGTRGAVVITDFFDHIPGMKNNAFFAIMGGTIGNFETYIDTKKLLSRLSEIFSMYRKAVGYNSYFLVSFDANTNAQEIVDCYDNPEFGGLVRSCVERVIDTSGFDYHVEWTPENYQLATGLKANRDQIIHFDGAQYAIEKSEYLPVLNSYRFPVPFVAEAAEKAGWVYRKTWSATGRTHYILFAEA